jgi:hypothetical protein
MLAIMGKKSSRRRSQGQVVTQPGEAQPHCPYCGRMNNERAALSLMDQLFLSHTELYATLRLAGRQILQSDKQSHGSLEKIRKVLKRADNMRKALQSADELPETLKKMDQDELAVNAPETASEYGPDKAVNGGPAPKNVQKRTRLARPRSLRIIRFPTG